MNNRKRTKTWQRTLVKYILLTIAGIILFTVGAKAAYAERGYQAIGGEGFLLFLPLFYWLFSKTIRDIVQDIIDLNSGEQDVEYINGRRKERQKG